MRVVIGACHSSEKCASGSVSRKDCRATAASPPGIVNANADNAKRVGSEEDADGATPPFGRAAQSGCDQRFPSENGYGGYGVRPEAHQCADPSFQAVLQIAS